jgi:hypothetical protein
MNGDQMQMRYRKQKTEEKNGLTGIVKVRTKKRITD